jgi:hypothetical protein
MRADEREKLLKEIEKKEDVEATRSMYFRVGKTAHKAITELAAISGANKSEVVRKLVTRGLTGKDIEIAKESHSVKLDWLVRESKRIRIDADALKKSIDSIRERIDWIERSELEASRAVQNLLVEIYCLVLAVFWAEKRSLSKLVKLVGTTFDEIQHSEEIASLEMANFLSDSVKDLDSLSRFHLLKVGPAFGAKNYNGLKADLIRNFVAEQRKKKGEVKK